MTHDPGPERAAAPVLSVVVPTRNEAGNVLPLYERITAALADVDFEVCFVDDSDDDTVAILGGLQEKDARVRCRFRQGAERNGGLSTAVIEGLHMARGRSVCVMDADLQHPPELIPELLSAANRNADLVVASRYSGKGSASGLDGFMRHAVSSGARSVARLLFSEARRSTDPLSGFFLCRRDLIDGIEFRPVGFKILLELLVCVPNLRVRDVPMTFAGRASGESKASMSQGVMFLKHVWSLFSQVSGSARPWKFATVGLSGLVIFIGLLELFSHAFHATQVLTFVAAFIPTVIWNSALNRRWTYADHRGRLVTPDTQRYLLSAVLSGVAGFLLYTWLRNNHVNLLPTGVLTALLTMVCNGALNAGRVSRRPLMWARVATDTDIVERLARLAEAVGADRAYVLPPSGAATTTNLPKEIVERVAMLRRATLWTEASFHRGQRRTNIDLQSTLLVPVADHGQTIALVVCEREQPTTYPSHALERATRAVEELAPLLATAFRKAATNGKTQ